MDWNWSDTFKGLIATTLGWVGAKSVKSIKPTYRRLNDFWVVTKKTEANEKSIEVIKETLEAFYNIDRDPIFMLSQNGELTYCNPAWVNLTGMPENEAKGFGYMRAVHPSERGRAERERDEIINHPVSYHGEVKILNLITKETITTICKTELIYHKKELIGTIGRLYVIS